MASQLHKTELMISLEEQIKHNMQIKAQIIKLQTESEQLETEMGVLQDRIKTLATGVLSLRHMVSRHVFTLRRAICLLISGALDCC